MSKRLLTCFTLLLILTTLFAACKPQATPTVAPTPTATPQPTALPTVAPTQPPASAKGTLILWHTWRETEIASLNEVIAAFKNRYPEITVDVLYVPFDELRGKYEVAASGGGGPTLLLGPADWGAILYDAGLVANVSDLASADFLATINPAALGAVQYKGALIGLPYTVKGIVMYRNKAIIPAAPRTFNDLLEKAKAASHDDVVGANLETGFFFSAAHIAACGGKLMEANGDPAFNNESGVCWLNLLKAFKDAGPTEYYSDKDVNLFRSGKAGIIMDGTWNAPLLAEAVGVDNLAIDPWPSYEKGNLSGFVQSEVIYLNANARGDDKAAAWLFMEYFLSPEAQAIMANPAKAHHLPAALNVELADRLMQEATRALEGGTAFPVIPEMGAYWAPMDAAIKSVLNDDVEPAKALQEAYDAVLEGIQQIRGQ